MRNKPYDEVDEYYFVTNKIKSIRQVTGKFPTPENHRELIEALVGEYIYNKNKGVIN